MNAARKRRVASAWASRILKALLVALVVFSSAPISSSHAKTHIISNGHELHAAVVVADVAGFSEQGETDGSPPISGVDHHSWCGCPCVGASHSRSSYDFAYFDGTRVRYSAYLGTLAAKFEPAPLRKPPRLAASA